MNTAIPHSNRERGRTLFALGFLTLLAMAESTIAQVQCQKVFQNPFDGNYVVRRMASHEGKLYIAVGGHTKSDQNVLKIFRGDDLTKKIWKDVTPSWTKGSPEASNVAMISFNGMLFVGTDTGELHCIDAKGAKPAPKQFGSTIFMKAFSSSTDNKSYLYLLANGLHRTPDGFTWQPLNVVFGPKDEMMTDGAFEVFQSPNKNLYFGFGYTKVTQANKKVGHGIQIWTTTDGTTWKFFDKFSEDYTSGLPSAGGSEPQHVHAMKAYGNHLYVGDYDGWGPYVYRTDGSLPAKWDNILLTTESGSIAALETYAGRLFAGRFSLKSAFVAGGKLLYYTSDGKNWSTVPGVPPAGTTCYGVLSMTTHNGKLYFGTQDDNGGEVFELSLPPSIHYLAGFDKPKTLFGDLKDLLNSLEKLKEKLAEPKLLKSDTAPLDDLRKGLEKLGEAPSVDLDQQPQAKGIVQAIEKEIEAAKLYIDFAKRAKDSSKVQSALDQAAGHGLQAVKGLRFLAQNFPSSEPKETKSPSRQPPAKQLATIPGAGIHGYVEELSEALDPIAGARIEFTNEGGQKHSVTSQPTTGYYRADLPPGKFSYNVRATGYLHEKEGREVQLQVTEGYLPFNFRLIKGEEPDRPEPKTVPQPIGVLKGRVVEAAQPNRGIPRANLLLRNLADSTQSRTVIARGTAGEEGNYEITMPAGQWHATVSAAGFDPFSTVDTQQPIEIRQGETASRDFQLTRTIPKLARGQGIQGKVTVAGANAARVDLSRVDITISPVATETEAAMMTLAVEHLFPDSQGRFSRDLHAGRYRVSATAVGHAKANSDPQTVYPGRYTHVDLVLQPLESPPTSPPVPLPRDEKLTLRVEVVPGGHAEVLQNGKTVGSGQDDFSVEVSSGDYIVYAPQTERFHAMAMDVTLTDANVNCRLVLTPIEAPKEPKSPSEDKEPLPLPVQVVHLVRGAGEQFRQEPLDGARVKVLLGEKTVAEGLSGEVDPAKWVAVQKMIPAAEKKGLFVSDPLPVVDGYYVFAHKEGFHPAEKVTPIKDRKVHVVVLQPLSEEPMEPGAKEPTRPSGVAIRVVDRETNSPLEGAEVTVGDGQKEWGGEPEREGLYRLAPLAQQKYWLHVARGGYREYRADFDLRKEIHPLYIVKLTRIEEQPEEPGEPGEPKPPIQPPGEPGEPDEPKPPIQPPGEPGEPGEPKPPERLPGVTIKVVDRETNSPLEGAEVIAGDGQKEWGGEPDRGGLYRLGQLPHRGYWLQVARDGYREYRADLDLRKGIQPLYVVQLSRIEQQPGEPKPPMPPPREPQPPVPPPGEPKPPIRPQAILIQVVDRATNAPLNEVEVIVGLGERQRWGGQPAGRGAYRFDELHRQNYWIHVRRGGYRDFQSPFDLRDQIQARYVIKLSKVEARPPGEPKPPGELKPPEEPKPPGEPPPQGATLVVHVQGLDVNAPIAALGPLGGATIVIRGNGKQWSGKTDGNGKFEIGLPPGRYQIEATLPTAMRPASTAVTVGKQGRVQPPPMVIKYRTPK